MTNVIKIEVTGTYDVRDGMVYATILGRTKAAQLGDTPADTLAQGLMHEIVADMRAASSRAPASHVATASNLLTPEEKAAAKLLREQERAAAKAAPQTSLVAQVKASVQKKIEAAGGIFEVEIDGKKLGDFTTTELIAKFGWKPMPYYNTDLADIPIREANAKAPPAA